MLAKTPWICDECVQIISVASDRIVKKFDLPAASRRIEGSRRSLGVLESEPTSELETVKTRPGRQVGRPGNLLAIVGASASSLLPRHIPPDTYLKIVPTQCIRGRRRRGDDKPERTTEMGKVRDPGGRPSRRQQNVGRHRVEEVRPERARVLPPAPAVPPPEVEGQLAPDDVSTTNPPAANWGLVPLDDAPARVLPLAPALSTDPIPPQVSGPVGGLVPLDEPGVGRAAGEAEDLKVTIRTAVGDHFTFPSGLRAEQAIHWSQVIRNRHRWAGADEEVLLLSE